MARIVFIDKSPSLALTPRKPPFIEVISSKHEHLIPELFGESDLILDFVKINNETVIICQTAAEDFFHRSYVMTDNGMFNVKGSF